MAIDPLTCKNCYHTKESHHYGYLECESFDFTWTIDHDWFGERGGYHKEIVTKACNCKAFQPFEDICSNKITMYIDRDLPDNTAAIWSHKAPDMVKSPYKDYK